MGNFKVFLPHSFKIVLMQICIYFMESYVLVLILSSLDAISKMGFIAILGGSIIMPSLI